MSSLAAARADNFYHPPDWDPRKESRAAHHDRKNNVGAPAWMSHPLRERAKKLDQGILTIRFEMPFNVRCTGCDNHIGKGVRFNAEKKAIGKYLSTKIWSFRMMCHCEDNTWRTDRRRNPHFIEIHTDPKNAEYIVAEGAEKVAEAKYEEALELGVEALDDPEEAAKRRADPFHMLEATQPKRAQGSTRTMRINELIKHRDEGWADDYATSQLLRQVHRQRRHEREAELFINQAKGISLDLLPEAPEDRKAAASAPLQYEQRLAAVRRGEKRMRLMAGSILSEVTPGDAKAKEAKRLKLLQMRRERGMQVTSAKPESKRGGNVPRVQIGPMNAAAPPRPCAAVAQSSSKATIVATRAAPAAALVQYSDSE